MLKTRLFTLLIALGCCANGAAQTIGYNYQAVLRGTDGLPLKNQSVALQFQILRSPAQTFNPSYAETHATLNTDQFGTVTAIVGKGVADFGRFDTIAWGSGPRYLRVLVKTPGNNQFVPLGEAREVVHQPFAGMSGDWIQIDNDKLYTNRKLGIGGIPGSASQAKILGDATGLPFRWGNILELASTKSKGALVFGKLDTIGNSFVQSAKIGGGSNLILNPETGNVGIGITNPSSRLVVDGDIHLDGSRRIYFQSGSNDPNYFMESYAIPNCAKIRVKGFCGINLATANGDILNIENNTVDVNGALQTNCLTIKGGCDVYEWAASTETLRPGEVTSIDPTGGSNAVRRSRGAYDRLVTGVVSGAGGINPGIGLRQEGKLDGDTPVALAGKVPVYVTGKVSAGDLLTSSSIPGRAMAVKNRRRAFGAVLGKALTAPDAEGLVLMLVMMQ